MEDDFDMEDSNPFAVPGLGTPEDRVRYTGQLTQLFDAQKAYAANQAAQYKAAEESIRQRRYGAPTTSEQLAALSQALIAPRKMRGFAGTLQNVLPALTQPAELRRRAEEQRAEDLMKLQQQQSMAASTAQMQALENQLKYGRPLLNQRAPQTTYDPFTGSVIDKAAGTATPVTRVPSKQSVAIAFSALREYISNPNVTPAQKREQVTALARELSMPPDQVMRQLGVQM